MPLPIKKNNQNNLLTRVVSKQEILDNIEEYRKQYHSIELIQINLLICIFRRLEKIVLLNYSHIQRIFLRAMARYKDVLLNIQPLVLQSPLLMTFGICWSVFCIQTPSWLLRLQPKANLRPFLESKVSEILTLLPILRFEIRKTEKVKDQFTIYFKNGSQMSNLAAKQSSRGLRFTGLTLEEIIEGDPDIIQEVIIPTLAIQRRAANGEFNKAETISQQKICVTTAGFKGYLCLSYSDQNAIALVDRAK